MVDLIDLGLADKVVIVTGGSGGLGLAFASALSEAGAKIVIADIDGAAAASAADALAGKGFAALATQTDVSDEASVEAMAEAAIAAFGQIDVLVNNAAIYATLERKPFTEISVAEWDRVMAVNLRGAFLCSKSVAKRMIGRGGKIVNIASATVFSGSPLWMHYVASKGGVIAMTRVMARELGEHGVTANVIAPGFTLTEASRSAIPDAETYGIARSSIKRASHPDDIVGACLWLSSRLSDFVTGQTIVVDGGKQFI
jgi:NAD(P)-dependent dehydrogenase (short-subunit alcohol dehydrogenase family)